MLPRKSDLNVLDRLAQYPDILHRLAISPVFGVPTRSALEVALLDFDLTGLALVYFDIDQLKQANELWGKVVSSRKIATALHARATDLLIGQWFSGDEFLALVPIQDATAYAEVLLASFKAQSMSATIVIIDPTLLPVMTIIQLTDYADEVVTTMKKAGLRGVITTIGK